MDIVAGMIARIKVQDWNTCATTAIHGDLGSEMVATHLLVDSVDNMSVRGYTISIDNGEYWLRSEYRWYLSKGDLRPTKLATTLRRID